MTSKNTEKRHHLMLSLDTSLYRAIKQKASEEDRSVPYIIKKILKEHIEI
jgi:hypothetical protein